MHKPLVRKNVKLYSIHPLSVAGELKKERKRKERLNKTTRRERLKLTFSANLTLTVF